jgi:hypothetical protein
MVELAGFAEYTMKIFSDFLKQGLLVASKYSEAENTRKTWKTLRK